jgi:hypothetical protein
MRVKLFVKVFIGLVILNLFSCASSEIFTDSDTSVNISRYQSFAWYPVSNEELANNAFNNQIIENNIKTEASSLIQQKGYVANIDSPDIIFEYHIMVEKKIRQEQQPIYNNNPYNYRNMGNYNPNWRGPNLNNINNFNNAPYIIGYKTLDIPYEEGTFTINGIDRRTNRLVWRGWAVGTIVDPMQYEDDIKRDIQRIFKNFPLQEKSQLNTKP